MDIGGLLTSGAGGLVVYDVALTRRRSPVQIRVGPLLFKFKSPFLKILGFIFF